MGQNDLTQKVVRDVLNYDPETGVFTWKHRDRAWFPTKRAYSAWNARYAGKRAGSVYKGASGYRCRQISLLGKVRKEHKLAWLWMTGENPSGHLDHKNRDGTDNRWVNIRESSYLLNGKNQSMSIANSSGVTGVSWSKSVGKWVANCTIRKRQHCLGYYEEIDEAAMAVMEFRLDNGFDPQHGMRIARYHQAT